MFEISKGFMHALTKPAMQQWQRTAYTQAMCLDEWRTRDGMIPRSDAAARVTLAYANNYLQPPVADTPF